MHTKKIAFSCASTPDIHTFSIFILIEKGGKGKGPKLGLWNAHSCILASLYLSSVCSWYCVRAEASQHLTAMLKALL